LYKIRFLSALAIALPVLFLAGWYAAHAALSHYRYNRAIKMDAPLTLDLFHLHLYDQIHRDLDRLTMSGPDKDSPIPSMELKLGTAQLDNINAKLPPKEGKGRYVPGLLRSGKAVYRVEVRYRGGKHWHWNYPQKSWKVRILGGEHMDGHRTFNFVNTPDPLPISEELILGVARKLGLMTPEYYPFRLFLNGTYLGIYFLAAQPDESLARLEERVPGEILSGNEAPIDEATGVSSLFASDGNWKRVAERQNAAPEGRSEALVRFLDEINSSSQPEFARFAQDHIDLRRFIEMDALDVVFGNNQHDFHRNHKLFFDPYRGRFEPVAWSFRGFEHRESLNRTENPILLRHKQLPAYVTLRNREVLRLLSDECSPGEVRKRAESLLRRLDAEQQTDPYWDAYHLLPPAGKYFEQLVRPMSLAIQDLVLGARLRVYETRAEYLAAELGKDGVAADYRSIRPGNAALAVSVAGNAGYELLRVVPHGPQCPAEWAAAAVLPSGMADVPDRRRLYPGTKLVPRVPVHPYRGAVRTEPAQRIYPFTVTGAPCAPEGLDVVLRNLVTDKVLVLPARDAGALPAGGVPPVPLDQRPDCSLTDFSPVAGQESLHPWCLQMVRPESIRLGPGPVRVDATRVFSREQEVEVLPGTRFEMGKDASLIFEGRVRMRGTAEAPITISSSGAERWGGLALVGPGTAGSLLSHVQVSHGTLPMLPLTRLPGMVTVSDTRDVTLEDCEISDNTVSDETFATVYVEGLTVNGLRVTRAASDALDIAMSRGRLARLVILDPGDECLDLMTSRIRVEDSVCTGWGGNAFSAGQATHLLVVRSVVYGGNVGVLVKDGSNVKLVGTLLSACKAILDVTPTNGAYPGKNRFDATATYATGCAQDQIGRAKTLKAVTHMARVLDPDSLPDLREDVMGIARWEDLPVAVDALRKGERP
jgi:hypothetical protein